MYLYGREQKYSTLLMTLILYQMPIFHVLFNLLNVNFYFNGNNKTTDFNVNATFHFLIHADVN